MSRYFCSLGAIWVLLFWNLTRVPGRGLWRATSWSSDGCYVYWQLHRHTGVLPYGKERVNWANLREMSKKDLIGWHDLFRKSLSGFLNSSRPCSAGRLSSTGTQVNSFENTKWESQCKDQRWKYRALSNILGGTVAKGNISLVTFKKYLFIYHCIASQEREWTKWSSPRLNRTWTIWWDPFLFYLYFTFYMSSTLCYGGCLKTRWVSTSSTRTLLQRTSSLTKTRSVSDENWKTINCFHPFKHYHVWQSKRREILKVIFYTIVDSGRGGDGRTRRGLIIIWQIRLELHHCFLDK